MATPIIKIENLSKIYRLGQIGTGTIRDDYKRWIYKIRGKEDPFLKIGEANDRNKKGNSDYIYALKDINLEVMPGEILGIIGKNGAGKSSLLKILSKVTGPTTGSISYNGRIGSLLEVGTGFHPELTGRENVFLNGAILGMTKTEIKSKFDEIVDFSGVERYIDTPVKRYSSGMMVRLGFAVAAHLEPEILVVDEVLAVGDAEFQKKAIGKMQDVSNNYGRTVLFVSHNMASVKTLCSRGIILENGRITQEGSTDQVISNYLKGSSGLVNFKTDPNKPMIDLPDIEIYSIGVKANNKDYNDIITLDDKITFSTRYKQKTNSKFIHITIHLKDELGNVVFTNGSNNTKIADDKEGLFDVSVVFPDNFFNWGSFYIDLYIVENKKNILMVEKDIVSFTVINKQQEIGQWMGKEAGPIHPRFDWQKMLIQ